MQFVSPLPAEGVSGCSECCSPEVAALQACEPQRAPEPAGFLRELVGMVRRRVAYQTKTTVGLRVCGWRWERGGLRGVRRLDVLPVEVRTAVLGCSRCFGKVGKASNPTQNAAGGAAARHSSTRFSLQAQPFIPSGCIQRRILAEITSPSIQAAPSFPPRLQKAVSPQQNKY